MSSGKVRQNRLWPGRGGPNVDYISSPPLFDGYTTPRSITILGSTGSIGVNALAVAEKGGLSIRGLACGRNISLLASQAEKFHPRFLVTAEKSGAEELSRLLKNKFRAEIYYGAEGFRLLAGDPETDCVVCAQMGGAGLDGSLAAALAGKMIALANKESLVMAGGLLRKICAETGAAILPVDSEHYALFQCAAGRGQTPSQFLLTASGGPFLHLDKAQFACVTPDQALLHPNWNMGKKITIDSATLMNKGLEFIEAFQLFGMPENNIAVLVHPQSIVHSLVRFKDNSLLAQLSQPDMKLPVSGCLFWPDVESDCVSALDLAEIGTLTFGKPDEKKFGCLALAKEACFYKSGGNWPLFCLNPAAIVLNAANDAAVELFLHGSIGFDKIESLVARALQELVYNREPVAEYGGGRNLAALAVQALENIRRLEARARQFVRAASGPGRI